MTTTEAPPPKIKKAPHPARRTLFEILAVLSLAVVPGIIYSAISFFYGDGDSSPASPLTLLLEQVLATFRYSVPVLYIMWATGKGFGHFGFRRLEPWDVLYALGILIGAFIFHVLVFDFFAGLAPHLVDHLKQVHESRILQNFAEAKGDAAVLTLIPACLLIGFTEELIFRAYLLTRLTDLTGSKYQALFLTTIIFGFGHMYQGALGIIGTAAIAAFYGTIFIVTKRFWPLAIAHAMNDFISLVSL